MCSCLFQCLFCSTYTCTQQYDNYYYYNNSVSVIYSFHLDTDICVCNVLSTNLGVPIIPEEQPEQKKRNIEDNIVPIFSVDLFHRLCVGVSVEPCQCTTGGSCQVGSLVHLSVTRWLKKCTSCCKGFTLPKEVMELDK